MVSALIFLQLSFMPEKTEIIASDLEIVVKVKYSIVCRAPSTVPGTRQALKGVFLSSSYTVCH